MGVTSMHITVYEKNTWAWQMDGQYLKCSLQGCKRRVVFYPPVAHTIGNISSSLGYFLMGTPAETTTRKDESVIFVSFHAVSRVYW